MSAPFAGRRQDWETPPWLFERRHAEHRFDVDAAASRDNALLPRYWSAWDSGLMHSWAGLRVWCNPPYGGQQLEVWLSKAHREVSVGECLLAELLVPVRTETKWWHQHVLGGAAEVTFIRGRLHFLLAGRRHSNSRPVFASALVTFRAGASPPPRMLSLEAPNPRRLQDGRETTQEMLFAGGRP